jgi:HlyD family secretion protein
MTMMAVPPPAIAPVSRPAGRRWWVWFVLLPAGSALAAAGGYWGWTNWSASRAAAAATPVKWHLVAAGEMQVKVHKDGELQAVNNTEIMSLVEGVSTIVQIVKEGAFVNAGDTLVTLDSSLIRQKIEDTTLELQRAESDVAAARNVLEIQRSQNEANLEAADVDVQLGKLSIQQYMEGTFPQELDTAKTLLAMKQTMRDNKADDLKQVRDLYAKNFVNLADVKAAELALRTVDNEYAEAATTLKVLQDYTHPMMLAGKQSYMKQAQQKFARTKVENQNNLTKATTALETQEAAKKIMERRLERFKEQLEYCTIKAPQAGLVVYNNMGGRGDSQAPIQEGTQVRERQILLRLPDTSAMKAVVRINEGQVIRLKHEQRAVVRVTGLREPIGASLTRISPVSDSSSRWMNPDTREYPVELALDWTPPNLKPGIGVQVEILVDQVADAVSVPLAAIYSAGADNFVFAKGGSPAAADAGGDAVDSALASPRKVNVGVANETHVRIVDGLKPGEQVVLLQAGQGRELLERAGIQPSPNDQPKIRKPGGIKAKPNGKPAAPAAPAAGEHADAATPADAGTPGTGASGAGTTGAAPAVAGGGTDAKHAARGRAVRPAMSTKANAAGEPAAH